jgi:putative transposase
VKKPNCVKISKYVQCVYQGNIELEWQHLKKDELASKSFDDELDLAYAIIDGVQTRG